MIGPASARDRARSVALLPQSFSRDSRLLTAAEFKRVFDAPLKSGDGLFTVLGRARPDPQSDNRLGLAIARKQLKRAVDRNRIKRISREVFRQLPDPGHEPAVDFIVMVRARAKQESNGTLAQSLDRHFRRLLSQAAQA